MTEPTAPEPTTREEVMAYVAELPVIRTREEAEEIARQKMENK